MQLSIHLYTSQSIRYVKNTAFPSAQFLFVANNADTNGKSQITHFRKFQNLYKLYFSSYFIFTENMIPHKATSIIWY